MIRSLRDRPELASNGGPQIARANIFKLEASSVASNSRLPCDRARAATIVSSGILLHRSEHPPTNSCVLFFLMATDSAAFVSCLALTVRWFGKIIR